MKRFFSIAILIVLAVGLRFNASAQVFSGGVGVIGTSNALVQTSFVTITNFAFSSLPSRTLQLQNITTNETVTVAYGFVFAGNGLTNLYIVGTNQYTFAASNGYVQGQTVTIPYPAYNFSVPVTPVGQIQIYTNNGANAYSNNVIFQ